MKTDDLYQINDTLTALFNQFGAPSSDETDDILDTITHLVGDAIELATGTRQTPLTLPAPAAPVTTGNVKIIAIPDMQDGMNYPLYVQAPVSMDSDEFERIIADVMAEVTAVDEDSEDDFPDYADTDIYDALENHGIRRVDLHVSMNNW